MLYLAQANSRMKDFYDVYMLATRFDFDGATLREAVYQTLTRRGTPMANAPVVLTDAFADFPGKIDQWRSFCRRIGRDEISFSVVLTVIGRFLNPIYQAILREADCVKTWRHEQQAWV